MYQQQFERRIQTNRLSAWVITFLIHGVIIAGIVVAGNNAAPGNSDQTVKTDKTLEKATETDRLMKGRTALP